MSRLEGKRRYSSVDSAKKQSTFQGWPFYSFSGDKKPGDISGHRIKDVWFIIDPATLTPYAPHPIRHGISFTASFYSLSMEVNNIS
jgi:hypothetical protein